MYAVVKTGGKQYKVSPDQKVTVERLPGEAGDSVELADVLLVSDDKGLRTGAPFLDGVAVAAEIVEQKRNPKIKVFKKTRRHTYRRTNGHRQNVTVLLITGIGAPGAAPKKAKAEAKKAAPKKAEAAEETKAAPKKAAAKKAGGNDDLKKITGLGPKLEEKLNGAGVTSYAQIAGWSASDIADIDEKLELKGRIERDDWVGQAKTLAAESEK